MKGNFELCWFDFKGETSLVFGITLTDKTIILNIGKLYFVISKKSRVLARKKYFSLNFHKEQHHTRTDRRPILLPRAGIGRKKPGFLLENSASPAKLIVCPVSRLAIDKCQLLTGCFYGKRQAGEGGFKLTSCTFFILEIFTSFAHFFAVFSWMLSRYGYIRITANPSVWNQINPINKTMGGYHEII